ncbi:MAG TPA: DNA mismatch repair endonuclease MutL [Pirellulales bacterium]|nr:DNA mismatch repair endonuclease MutL [Pirellulales bacterium]
MNPASTSMPVIQQLPPSVVNKIAAGEVIERPASVVKELMENSLDAGSTRVDVAVEQGGLELIRVVDNGCGIAGDELPLAVASHATSKLRSAEDLFHVSTLGFRGEALASIAEVSRLVLRSRQSEEAAGAELVVSGGEIAPVAPCGCAVGTAIEVRQLFYNTPVRRRFLRSAQTEMGHITEAFTRLALAHPGVHFTLRHNQRPLYELPPATAALERLAHFFGRDLADDLIWLESRDGQVRLSGFVGHPNLSRPNGRMQYLFLNGRAIRDRSLAHALSEAYRGLLLSGRYPVAFLFLDMPPELVDVNVHPTKLEVRFQDGGRLYSQLLGTLRSKFLATDLTHRLTSPAAGATRDPSGTHDPTGAHDPGRAEQLRGELVDWAKGQTSDTRSVVAEPPARQGQFDIPRQSEMPRSAVSGFPRVSPVDLPPGPAGSATAAPNGAGAKINGAGSAVSSRPAGGPSAMQVHNRYLVVETDDGVAVIDQHALHERILYEQFRERALAGTLDAQQLLVPEPVDLGAAEAAAVLEHRQLLATLGLAVEAFGGGTVLVSSYPAMLGGGPEEILRSIVDLLTSGGRLPDRRDLLDELLHMMSCKAAIKAGDPLAPDEIVALLAQRHLAQDSHHCPHGRPTELLFTREELDRQFKRT